MSTFVDPNSRASHPGHLHIERDKFIAYHHPGILKRVWYSALLRLPDTILHRLTGDDMVYDYLLKKEHFQLGCINPTIVLDVQRGLIATYTNLSAIGRYVPAIKISVEPLHLITNTDVSRGTRLATVSLYYRNPADEWPNAWADFSPKVANCFTDDAAMCAQLLAQLNTYGWQCLDQGLRQIKDTTQPGLHLITLHKELMQKAGG